METAGYISEIKRKYHLKRDVEVAKKLKVHKTTVGAYKNNKAQFGPETALKVAELLKLPPAKVSADMMAAKAKYKSDKQKWMKAAAALCVVGIVSGLPIESSTTPHPTLSNGASNIYYVK